MKAIGLTEFGGPEVLLVVTLPSPEPGPGEVRIRVHAGRPHAPHGGSCAGQVRDLVPGGIPGLVDGANLDAAALPAIADGGAIATVKGWSGPAGRGITVHPISAFTAVTRTALLEDLRDLTEHGVLTLRAAGVMPASQAAGAHRRLAGGLRGRLALDFEAPLPAPGGASQARS